jgi:hypothetical protein
MWPIFWAWLAFELCTNHYFDEKVFSRISLARNTRFMECRLSGGLAMAEVWQADLEHVPATGAKAALANRRLPPRGAGPPVKVIVSVRRGPQRPRRLAHPQG